MLIYLLKMIACSAAFYGLYALLFRNEKMLVFNRFYLLAALIASCIIPFIRFTVYITGNANPILNLVEQPIKEQYGWFDYTMTALAMTSVLGSTILLVRFIKNLLSLKRRVKNSYKSLDFKGAKIILLRELVVPHSFLNTIFLNSDEYEGRYIEKEVLEHELAHVRQRHSWDVLFVEILQIFCWFNPLIYLYKRSIKINHELLADAAVVKELDNMRSYQHILLQRAGAQPSLALASSFHFLITKKRIIMLQKKVNPAIARLKAMLCLPLLALLVFTFSERVYAQGLPPPPPKPAQPATTSKGKPADVDVFIVKTKKDNKSEAIIKYKNGKEVSGDVSTPEKKKAFEKQYGVELPPPPPPPAPPIRRKKMSVPPPPPPAPPKPKKSEPVISFTPPVIVKDKKINEASAKHQEPAVAATKQVKRLAPPVIVKDDEVHKVINESSPAEGVDKARRLEF